MSAPPDEQQAQSQSYLKSSISKYSPWSRSPAVQPSKGKDGEPNAEPLLQQNLKGEDHVVTHRHRLSLRKYPRDCPPLRPQWFHAVDVPKRRPNPAGETKEPVKPAPAPKKYAAFSVTDSKAIEAVFQKLADQEDAAEAGKAAKEGQSSSGTGSHKSLKDGGKFKVPVNEDYLFDVDVNRRELGPAYWQGPIYDVRRGTWFYQDSSVQRPCDENLAAQLEEGYLKVAAWRLPTAKDAKGATERKQRPTSWAPGQAPDVLKNAKSGSLTPKASNPDLRAKADGQNDTKLASGQESPPNNTYRLFGAHMNSVVTYQDANTAWLLTDDFLSRMNYSMYQRFAGGGHFAGVKMTRGYVPGGAKKTESKDGKAEDTKRSASEERAQKEPVKTDNKLEVEQEGEQQPQPSFESKRQTLERQMSSLLEDAHDPAKQDEEMRRRDEREIEDDYKETDGEDQGREIEHLILVTHGIGQRLGLRIESVNFVHDVNTLRKTLKAVYADSPDLRALNAELDAASKTNCRVQVLPICWRHLLDFPKQSLKHNRKEHDLGDSGFGEDEDYPNLADISVEGVPAVRNLITDLALDILLYQSPAYKDHIARIVLEECNRIYHLFMERNPDFKGKVSMIGHSLGSAVMFDILCEQQQPGSTGRRDKHPLKLDFEVEDFYALGSPIGLFQMLKGRTIASREQSRGHGRTGSRAMDDPMLSADIGKKTASGLSSDGLMGGDIPTSRPKCSQIFNIFHPTDPISYRIEPLISPAMASLKPQPLPYTKRGIFGAPVGQGLTGIGARVGQSVSSLWSSMSSGLASSLLTRGLGYSGDVQAQLPSETTTGADGKPGKSSVPLSMGAGAGTGVAAGVVPTSQQTQELAQADPEKQARLATETLAAGAAGQHPPTLIDQELETLYSGYEKTRRSSLPHDKDAPSTAAAQEDLAEAEERGKRLRREEEKVRRLNSNGRVDYAIQEGAFDINLLAAIASHLSYWGDEDVSHFMISQLLSRHRVVGRGGGVREDKTT